MPFVLKMTTSRDVQPCALCGEPVTIVPPGPELYVDGTRKPLCSQCREVHAPALARLLDLAVMADAFSFVRSQPDGAGEDPEEVERDLRVAAVAFSVRLRVASREGGEREHTTPLPYDVATLHGPNH